MRSGQTGRPCHAQLTVPAHEGVEMFERPTIAFWLRVFHTRFNTFIIITRAPRPRGARAPRAGVECGEARGWGLRLGPVGRQASRARVPASDAV